MTNGDYIRQMVTDDYIAQRFCSNHSACTDCPLYKNPKCGSFEERIKWLEEEYVEEEEVEVEYSDFCDDKSERLSELEEIRYILSDLVKRIGEMEEEMS